MSGNLIPNSTDLVELTRIFRQIQTELNRLHGNQQTTHATAQQALSFAQSATKSTQPEATAQSYSVASPDAITMVVSSIPPA